MTRTILTVDDSRSLRQMLVFSLQAAGFDVLEAEDGEEGLAVARKHEVDLVLTDQNMPKLDGLGLIRALRATPRYQRTPILMLTTESSDAMKQRGREAGATGWLVKPFDPATLTAVVHKVLA